MIFFLLFSCISCSISSKTFFTFSFSFFSIIKRLEPDTYDVLGHYTLNGEEHKYDLRLHYKGGEWTAISNWEWSRLQLMRVGATDLDEDLHGTWTDDVSF